MNKIYAQYLVVLLQPLIFIIFLILLKSKIAKWIPLFTQYLLILPVMFVTDIDPFNLPIYIGLVQLGYWLPIVLIQYRQGGHTKADRIWVYIGFPLLFFAIVPCVVWIVCFFTNRI